MPVTTDNKQTPPPKSMGEVGTEHFVKSQVQPALEKKYQPGLREMMGLMPAVTRSVLPKGVIDQSPGATLSLGVGSVAGQGIIDALDRFKRMGESLTNPLQGLPSPYETDPSKRVEDTTFAALDMATLGLAGRLGAKGSIDPTVHGSNGGGPKDSNEIRMRLAELNKQKNKLSQQKKPIDPKIDEEIKALGLELKNVQGSRVLPSVEEDKIKELLNTSRNAQGRGVEAKTYDIWKARQENPDISIAALAKQLGMNPSYVSQELNYAKSVLQRNKLLKADDGIKGPDKVNGPDIETILSNKVNELTDKLARHEGSYKDRLKIMDDLKETKDNLLSAIQQRNTKAGLRGWTKASDEGIPNGDKLDGPTIDELKNKDTIGVTPPDMPSRSKIDASKVSRLKTAANDNGPNDLYRHPTDPNMIYNPELEAAQKAAETELYQQLWQSGISEVKPQMDTFLDTLYAGKDKAAFMKNRFEKSGLDSLQLASILDEGRKGGIAVLEFQRDVFASALKENPKDASASAAIQFIDDLMNTPHVRKAIEKQSREFQFAKNDAFTKEMFQAHKINEAEQAALVEEFGPGLALTLRDFSQNPEVARNYLAGLQDMRDAWNAQGKEMAPAEKAMLKLLESFFKHDN